MTGRLCLTALAVGYALFPPRPENSAGKPTIIVAPSAGHIAVNGANLRFYLADLDRAVTREGKLALLFPGCLSLAAPFLLFRLKREGFSDCRALITADGLLLSATR